MAVNKKVYDSISANRTMEIMSDDESKIELNLGIYLHSEVGKTNANSRLNSLNLSKILVLVEHLLIKACQCSDEDLNEMVRPMGMDP